MTRQTQRRQNTKTPPLQQASERGKVASVITETEKTHANFFFYQTLRINTHRCTQRTNGLTEGVLCSTNWPFPIESHDTIKFIFGSQSDTPDTLFFVPALRNLVFFFL
ncbi:hypothetical protein CEXT_32581 [Caerostris extrusa]|uniref:Uncharacterized protein n=1 Tax=Caerostris extrusa TaxID=172846 RepID=A0AAV4SHL8_CAEEX|nr:hypothetical protein CEXT_32581 [Caerostris extrusa]